MSALDEGDGYLGHREIRLDRPPDQIDLEAVAHGFDIFQPDFPQGAGVVSAISAGYVAQ